MIWTAFGQALPSAVGIAVSPIPVVLVILMLVSARARTNGPAFLIGWFAGTAIIAGVAFAVADGADAATDSSASDGVNVLQLVLGLLFLALAVKQWRSRPKPGEEPATPKLFATVDTMTAAKSLGLGFVACAANPNNLPLAASAGAAMAQTGVSGSQATVAILLFVIVASSSVAAPVVVYLAMGERADGILATWKTWLIANNSTVMMVLFVILGAKMLGAGLGVAS